MLKIQKCEFSDIAHLAKYARRDKVSLYDSPRTRWWSAAIDGNVIGCGAIMALGKRRCRLRGAFVLPRYRNQGVGEMLLRVRLEEAKSFDLVDARTYQPGWFVRNGWKITKYFGNCVEVQRC